VSIFTGLDISGTKFMAADAIGGWADGCSRGITSPHYPYEIQRKQT
jgi:hypothetical protein